MKRKSVSRDKALLIAKFCSEKKAENILILDLRGLATFCDYFVICSGSSSRRTRAIAEFVDENLRKKGIIPWHIEGWEDANWLLLDYGDVIVHIFQPLTRDFYALERLWGDAALVPINEG